MLSIQSFTNCSASNLIFYHLTQSQRDTHGKKNAPAKFISSQAKSTEHAEISSEAFSGTSLFEILRRSSMQKGDTRDNRVDHHAVFAAFKPVKKRIKTEGRS